VRGDLLEKLGCADEAREEFERAASLTKTNAKRTLPLARGAGCTSNSPLTINPHNDFRGGSAQ
jgi:predicted RNA polymerase sigma factor